MSTRGMLQKMMDVVEEYEGEDADFASDSMMVLAEDLDHEFLEEDDE